MENDDEEQPVGITAASLTLLTAALWGGTPVAVSYSVDTLPPVAVAAMRFALAFVFMVAWCRWMGTPLSIRRAEFARAAIVGTLLFVQITTFNLGIHWSNSSHSTLLINSFVFWVLLIEHFTIPTARLSGRKIAGVILAAGGIVTLFLMARPPAGLEVRDPPTLAGDAMSLISGAILGVKIVYTKRSVRVVDPGKLILWHHVVGVTLFTLFSMSTERVSLDAFNTAAVLGLLYQGLLVAGFCFAIQAWLLKRHAASAISVFSFSTPLFGLVLACLFRGDHLSPWLILSALLVACGIYVVNRAG